MALRKYSASPTRACVTLLFFGPHDVSIVIAPRLTLHSAIYLFLPRLASFGVAVVIYCIFQLTIAILPTVTG